MAKYGKNTQNKFKKSFKICLKYSLKYKKCLLNRNNTLKNIKKKGLLKAY